MKTIYTLLAGIFICYSVDLSAQDHIMNKKIKCEKHVLKNRKAVEIVKSYQDVYNKQANLADGILLDYDQEDRDYSSSISNSTMVTYIWPLNANYTHDDTNTLTRAIVVFDTLTDGTPGITDYYPVAKATLTIDSLDIWISHSNNSGMDDSIKIRILDAQGLAEVGNNYSGVVLWDTTLVTDTSLTMPNVLRVLTVRPNLDLSKGQTFAVQVDYIGPLIDTFYIVGGERDDCMAMCYAEPSIIPNNSGFYLNFITPVGNDLSGFNYLVVDCDADGTSGTPGSCEFYGPQNIFFFAYVSGELDSMVAINEISSGKYMDVYPNPAKDQLMIEYQDEHIGQSPIVILYDARGSKVYEEEFRNQEPIDIGALHPGIYNVMIKTEIGSAIKRISVVR